jgi:hypothetical protein
VKALESSNRGSRKSKSPLWAGVECSERLLFTAYISEDFDACNQQKKGWRVTYGA